MKSTKDSLLEDIKAEFAEVNAMMEALEAKEPEDEASQASQQLPALSLSQKPTMSSPAPDM